MMNWRSLTLLLILANLFYWARGAWIVQPEIVGMEDHRIADVQLLELAAPAGRVKTNQLDASLETPLEVKSGALIQADKPLTVDVDSINAPEAASSGGLAAQSPVVCRRIGAFVNEKSATEAAIWFETEGIRSEKTVGTDTVWQGYWVYLPKYANREAAGQVVSALREKGIKDLYIEVAGPNLNAVSLGLYRKRAGAETRLRQIQAQGYPARIGNKEREQDVFWLETRIEADREIPLHRLKAPSGQVRRIEVKDCQ